MSFILCKSCCRHVKHNESRCPFCGSDIRTTSVAKTAAVGMVLVGLGLALACGGTTEEGGGEQDASTDQGQAGAYGPPPADAAPDVEEDGPVAAYGPPPVDAAYGPPPVDAAEDVADDGPVAAYGPPPVDAALDGAYGPPPDAEADAPMTAYGPPPPIDAGVDAPDDAMSGAYGPPPDGF